MFFLAHILTLIDNASTLWDSASKADVWYFFRLHKRAFKWVLLKSNSLTINDYAQLNTLNLKKKQKQTKVK